MVFKNPHSLLLSTISGTSCGKRDNQSLALTRKHTLAATSCTIIWHSYLEEFSVDVPVCVELEKVHKHIVFHNQWLASRQDPDIDSITACLDDVTAQFRPDTQSGCNATMCEQKDR